MEEKPGIAEAVELADGSPSKLARLIGHGVKRQHVEYWLRTGSVPVDRCTPLEQALQSRVPRWRLRPHDWHVHWPELKGAPGAPEPTVMVELEASGAA